MLNVKLNSVQCPVCCVTIVHGAFMQGSILNLCPVLIKACSEDKGRTVLEHNIWTAIKLY